MPAVPSTSPVTSLPTPSHYIHTTSFSFVDVHGRTLLLRGVNLSGASKAPPSHLSHILDDFWESAERGGESFVGRPLRLDDGSADVHLARLRGWGFNLLRFPFTWEALEREGPKWALTATSGWLLAHSVKEYSYSGDPILPPGECSYAQLCEQWKIGSLSYCSLLVVSLPTSCEWVYACSLIAAKWLFPFARLKAFGGGKYDYEFMDYTIQVLVKCKEYGFKVYMDPHQDTWSRFSGGSGAPYWTLPACGISPYNITATQAAILHSEYPSPYPSPDPSTLPAMIWSTNYGRLLSQTIFTLFFAGRDFAPKCIIDNMNIQDWLQSHYIEAVGQLADRIKAYDNGSLLDTCLIGWDSLNEPFEGLCGWDDLSVNPQKQGSTLKKGTYPTPAQSMRLGMGQKQTVEHWAFGGTGPKKDGNVTIDPKGRKLWADPVDPASPSSSSSTSISSTGELPDGTHPVWGWKRDVSSWPLGTCIWALHGVWDVETGYVLQPDYFKYNPQTSLEVEFLSDYWKSHWLRYSARIKKSHEEAMIFVQPPVFAIPPKMTQEETGGRCVYSPHYYDGLTLITRHWNWFNADALGLLRGKYGSTLGAVKLGEKAIRKSLWEQMGYLKEDVRMLGGSDSPSSIRGEYPTLIGEIGTPFDMDEKRSYGWTDGGKYKGDYSPQERALDASLQACDARDEVPKKSRPKANTMQEEDEQEQWQDDRRAWGDGWNMEDLSLWSVDDLDLDSEDEGERADPEEHESGVVKDEHIDDQLGMEMMEDEVGEDALHSRAQLLLNTSHSSPAQDNSTNNSTRSRIRNSISKKIKSKRGRTGTVKRQPARSAPMSMSTSVMSSSLSLDTLNGEQAGGSHSASFAGRRDRNNVVSQRKKRARGLSTSSSSSTLSSSSSSSSASLRKAIRTQDALIQAGYNSNPYTFLTAGARAVRAFARPWPVKVVGKAVEVKFDIAKGVFWMKVRVGWEDAVIRRDEQEELGTEVYLPLVHFAHERLINGSFEKAKSEKWNDVHAHSEVKVLDSDADADAASGSGGSSTVAASSDHEDHDQVPPSMTASTSSQKTKSSPTPPTKTPLITPSPAPLLIKDSTPDLIDVEVKVSGGRYEVRGQGLVWWYDVPPKPQGTEEGYGYGYGKGQEGGKWEYTIEVRRKGGVLPAPKSKPRPGAKGVKVKGKPEPRQVEGARSERSWCEKICCPEDGSFFGCCVA
ncbi:hypothetical protein CPB84DRAFT_1751212 [Gymnopilus junonius]|uniref:Glycoside hydrolase family 5 C-terminal domain-containing protein n=1 Tax=Gymnopilus junonius TaxID=109634 RepID=A0A9P5THE7_GYMJU|nr:hypothetical protein CPB84DRAFT_1751212 [Gymnopilus junonius]